MADYIETTNDDAARQQVVAQAFHLFADVLAGSDSQPRVDSQTTRADGLLGPPNNNTDVAVGANGDVFVRGRSGTYTRYAAGSAPAAAAASAGQVITPGMIVLGLLVLMIVRH